MTEVADLEIGLHRRDADSYAVEFRFIQPGSDADIRLSPDTRATAHFDFDNLRWAVFDARDYGHLLTQCLFADPDVRSAFAQATASARALDVPLRLRLLIGPSAPELHALHWETLLDPQDGSWLGTGEDLFFSRYLGSLDWRPVRLRPKGQLRALVMVANPADLERQNMTAVDVAGEIARARQGLGEIPVTAVPEKEGDHATLGTMIGCLREGYDILYLVCHGALRENEPWLWLEN